MFFKKKNYDFIFGIGEACSCSSTLRSCNLQIKSLPFDWLFGSSFLGRVNMIANNFDNFIRAEDLEIIGDNGIESHLCDIYRNNYNGLIFNHDFLHGSNINEAINDVAQKYKRRADRLYDQANKAKSILVVWIDTPGANWTRKNNADFVEGHKILAEKFSHAKVDLVVFAYEKGLDFKNYRFEKINDNIEKYTFDYHKMYHKKKLLPDYIVDEKLMHKILKNYGLNISLKEKWDNYIFKKFKK